MSELIRIVAAIVLTSFVGSVFAYNRNDVFAELEKLNTTWAENTVDVWINDRNSEPGVLIGDSIVYHMRATTPGYFVLILVDSKGSVSILKPDSYFREGELRALPEMDFPFGGSANCEAQYSATLCDEFAEVVVKQQEPLGKETVFLIVSKDPMDASVFGLTEESGFVTVGSDLSKLTSVVEALDTNAINNPLAMQMYQYSVDSDTQLTTRGISLELDKRIEDFLSSSAKYLARPLIANDIQFEFDSDILTSKGIQQLDVLGSDLVERQGEDALPTLSLTGHTDSVGDAAYNTQLSLRRAMAAKLYLTDAHGLPWDAIKVYGKGESEPVSLNSTDVGRAENRRVEIAITE